MNTAPSPTPAGCFAAKKPRIDTIGAALEVFSRKITSPETASSIRKILDGGSVAKIDITAHRNAEGKITLRLDCASKVQHDSTTFGGLS